MLGDALALSLLGYVSVAACTALLVSTSHTDVFSIYLNSHGVLLAPWILWENVHYDFCRVEFVPSVIWRSIPAFNTSVELTRWLFPLSAFLFFALFDFASEAQKQYRSLFRSCHKALLRILRLASQLNPLFT